jgi:hypothetical protein
MNHMADAIEELPASERRKIGTRLKKTSNELNSLIERVERGET